MSTFGTNMTDAIKRRMQKLEAEKKASPRPKAPEPKTDEPADVNAKY